MKWKLLAFFLLSTSLALVATASGDGKFEWTTKSADAKKLIHELQSRIENFQFGKDTTELARNLVAADPDFAMGVYYLSAVVPGDEGNEALEKATKLSESASEGERRFIEAMAVARANAGANFADAVPKLEALGSDYPNERLVQMILGQIYQGVGDAEKARSAFERALEIGPSSSRARSFIANDDLLHGKYRQARTSFEAIEKELPKGTAPAPIRYGLAFSYLYEGKDQAALGALDTFLKEYRDSGQTQIFPEVFIWNSIARIHLENGRAEEAMKAYAKGYESVPESGITEDQKQVWYGRLKHGRARTFAKLGRFDEAREEAKAIHKMIEEGGETAEQYLPAYHYLAGYLELEAGNAEKAVEHLKQSNPNDPFHKLLLARGLDEIGERENALKAYQDVVDSTNNGLERALAYPEAKQQLKKG